MLMSLRTRLIYLLVLATSTSLHAADVAELAEQCDGCHGPNGLSENVDVPAIAGFAAYATLDLLESYRNGQRKARRHEGADGIETDMRQISEGLTATETQAIADHYAAQRWQPREQPFDKQRAQRGADVHDIKCAGCHSDHGGDPDDELALLLGQWREYLSAEFRKFDDGSRALPDKMGPKYESLSAADKQALLELYASGGNL